MKTFFSKTNIYRFLIALGTIATVNRVPSLRAIVKPKP